MPSVDVECRADCFVAGSWAVGNADIYRSARSESGDECVEPVEAFRGALRGVGGRPCVLQSVVDRCQAAS